MKYSLILPVYNVSSYLERCLDSILKQDFSDYEVILVNDGSIDQSGEICDHYASSYDNIRVFHNVNKGVAYTRNFGLKQAKGEYVWFIDPDDYILGNPLGELVSHLDSTKPDVLMFGYFDEKETTGKQTVQAFPIEGTLQRQEFFQQY